MLSLSKLTERLLSARQFCEVLGTVMHKTDTVSDSCRKQHHLRHRGHLQILSKKDFFTIQRCIQRNSCKANFKAKQASGRRPGIHKEQKSQIRLLLFVILLMYLSDGS